MRAGYQVRDTAPAQHQRPRRYTFSGRAGAIEPTALVARQFAEATTPTAPYLTVIRPGPARLPTDSVLLRQACAIASFYNHTLGRLDSTRRFRVLLPGTNRDAFALLANAVAVSYRAFDMQQRDGLLILAH